MLYLEIECLHFFKTIFSVERGADGVTVIYWYHRQFIEAARERYCQEESSTLHSGLADFFLGVWAKGKVIDECNKTPS